MCPSLCIGRPTKPKEVTSSLPLTNNQDKPRVYLHILTVVSATTLSICYSGSSHLFLRLVRRWLSLYHLQLAHRRNCRSKIDLLSVPDRLPFKRTAKLPLPSLGAVKPRKDTLGKYRHHHEPYITLRPPRQFLSALCDSATRTSTTTHESLALISFQPFSTSQPIAIGGQSIPTPSPR